MNWKVAVLLFGLWIAQLVSESLSVALQKPQLSIMIVPVGVTVASLTLPFNHGVITSFFLGLIMDAMLGTAMGYHAAAALWLTDRAWFVWQFQHFAAGIWPDHGRGSGGGPLLHIEMAKRDIESRTVF